MLLDGRNFVKVGTCFFPSPLDSRVFQWAKKGLAIGKIFEKTNRNSGAFPPEVVAVYRRNASQPGALKAMINFYRGWLYGYLDRERKWRNGLFAPITTPTLMI